MKRPRLDFGRPAIAGAVSDRELDLIDRETLEAIDLIELRVDHFTDLTERYVRDVFEKAGSLGKPIIATVRAKEEGGQREISEDERVRLFEVVTDIADIIDIEARSAIFNEVKTLVMNASRRLIASYHDFEATPSYSELSGFVKEYKSRGVDIVKIATNAVNTDDLRSMTLLTLDYYQEELVTICMGKKGLITRVFFPIIGSLFTFASIGSPTAPGQVSAVELRRYMEALAGDDLKARNTKFEI